MRQFGSGAVAQCLAILDSFWQLQVHVKAAAAAEEDVRQTQADPAQLAADPQSVPYAAGADPDQAQDHPELGCWTQCALLPDA